jgi:hypothetical protein
MSLLVSFAIAFAAPTAPPASGRDQPCNVKSVRQANGQTACEIINEGEDKNSGFAKLSNAMVLRNKNAVEALAQIPSVHIILYDEQDPSFQDSLGSSKVYVVIAGSEGMSDDLFPKGSECHFPNDKGVAGVQISSHPAPRLTLDVQVLSKTHPLIASLCKGLGLPFGQQMNGEAGRASRISNYDAAQHRLEFTALVFVPGTVNNLTFEDSAGRYYWANVLGDSGIEAIIAEIKDRYGANLFELTDELAKSGSARMVLKAPGQSPFFARSSLTPPNLRAFGDAIREMDRRWEAFGRSSRVQVNGKSGSPLIAGASLRLLYRVRLVDLQSPGFWTHLDDASEYLSSTGCLATIFTVDQGYASISELPAYRECFIRMTQAASGNRN